MLLSCSAPSAPAFAQTISGSARAAVPGAGSAAASSAGLPGSILLLPPALALPSLASPLPGAAAVSALLPEGLAALPLDPRGALPAPQALLRSAPGALPSPPAQDGSFAPESLAGQLKRQALALLRAAAIGDTSVPGRFWDGASLPVGPGSVMPPFERERLLGDGLAPGADNAPGTTGSENDPPVDPVPNGTAPLGAAVLAKLQVRSDEQDDVLWVRFVHDADTGQVDAALADRGLEREKLIEGGGFIVKARAGDAAAAARHAREIAALPEVASVLVGRGIAAGLGAAPGGSDEAAGRAGRRGKLGVDPSLAREQLQVLTAPMDRALALALFDERGLAPGSSEDSIDGARTWRLSAHDGISAVRAAASLAASGLVKEVKVNPQVAQIMHLPLSSPEPAPATEESPAPDSWPPAWTQNGPAGSRRVPGLTSEVPASWRKLRIYAQDAPPDKILFQFPTGLDIRVLEALLTRLGFDAGRIELDALPNVGYMEISLAGSSPADAVAKAAALLEEELVREVWAHPSVVEGMKRALPPPTAAASPAAAPAEPEQPTLPGLGPLDPVPAAPALHPDVAGDLAQAAQETAPPGIPDRRKVGEALPEGEKTLLVKFTPETTRDASMATAQARGPQARAIGSTDASGVRHVMLSFDTPEDAAAKAFFLTAESSVVSIHASPDVKNILDELQTSRQVLPEATDGSSSSPIAPGASPAPGAARKAPRRDVRRAFEDFLNTRKLPDGSTLAPKHVALLQRFIKPVMPPPEKPLPPVVEVSDVLKEVIPVLASPRGGRTSVFMIGPKGVGKTAIAEGLAQLQEDIEAAEVTGDPAYLKLKRLKGRWIVSFDLDEILSPAADEDPMQLFKFVLKTVQMLNDANVKNGNQVILVFDEFHKLFMDPVGRKIANYLKAPLRDGEISMLAMTTEKEFTEFIEKDEAFVDRAEVKRLKEPDVAKTIKILRGSKGYLEDVHDTTMPDETLVAAAKLTHQFVLDAFNPRKSVNALKKAAELARPDNIRLRVALEIKENWRLAREALGEAAETLMKKGVASTVALPVELYNQVAAIAREAVRLYQEHSAVQDGVSLTTPDILKRVISDWTGIKAGQLTLGEEDTSRYLEMEGRMAERVVNQDMALTALARAIRRNKSGLGDPSKPMGRFIFAGPTGVGKTYIAKELARFLFKDPTAMTRIDFSEYMEKHSAMRLIGAPPSFVGHDEGGQLTEAVRTKPYQVILFDEMEKAHPDVMNILLQILDDGRLTDGHGRTVDFKNTVIIMTTNIGMDVVDHQKYERLLEKETDPVKRAAIEDRWEEEIALAIREGLRLKYRPEFLNRFDPNPENRDQWVTFKRLRRENVGKVARIQVEEFKSLLRERQDGTELEIAEDVYEFLTEHGYSPSFGARPMKSAIEKYIVDPLALWVLEETRSGNKKVRGGLIKVTIKDGQPHFEAFPKPYTPPEPLRLEGAAERLAKALLDGLDSHLQSGKGLPGTEELDVLLRGLLDPAGPGADSSAPGTTGKEHDQPVLVAPTAFFPDTAMALPESAQGTVGDHNDPGLKDDALRRGTKAVLETARDALWSDEAAKVLAPDGASEGALKLLIRHAKGLSPKIESGLQETTRMVWKADVESLRLVVHRPGGMEAAERAFWGAHFTGQPPQDLLAAQSAADHHNFNLSPGGTPLDPQFLELYRRLAATGGRLGFTAGSAAYGGSGTDYWIEFRRPEDPPAPAQALTPHQDRERARTQGLILKALRQDGVSQYEQDGPAVKIAAATAYAWLSAPQDAKTVRGWIAEKGWASRPANSSKVERDWPLVMAAALVLERFGAPRDIPIVESLLKNLSYSSSDHTHRPVHSALVTALGALYARAGVQAARKVLETSADERDVKEAAFLALGAVGEAQDADKLLHSPDAFIALHRRVQPQRLADLLAQYWPPQPDDKGSYSGAAWRGYPSDRHMALLKLVGAKEDVRPADMEGLAALLEMRLSFSHNNERPVLYAAAQAWADLAARDRRTRGLARALESFLDKNSMTNYNDKGKWPVLLAYVYLLQQAGGAENLPLLEAVMSRNPGSVQAVHEEAFFEAPMAWAQTVVRTGKFQEYIRPQAGPDGAPRLSKLQEMLASKNPMFAAAALYAVALARQAPAPASPGEEKDVPALSDGEPSQGGSGRSGGFFPGAGRGSSPRLNPDPFPF